MRARAPSPTSGFAVLLCAGLALFASTARTDIASDTPAPSALTPDDHAAVPTASVAIVIGNNRSRLGARADLRYADDDAFRTTEALRALVPNLKVALLTRADDESARLHPDLSQEALAPTRAAFDDSVSALQAVLDGARGVSRDTELFIVFAGHGERDEEGGYLELEDGALRRADLIEAIARIAPTRAHVVLDACNSFFVVHARRPGGRPFVLSHEVEQGLSVPGVDVGVLLSTSADAQVYEWSDLSGGVFSHAFRSGLLGPADADDDGSISYREMKAFIEIATRDVPNAEYRPHLYVRAPETDRLVTLPASARLPVDAPHRVTARDARGVRLVDARFEPGYRPRIVLSGAAPFSLFGVFDDDERPRAVILEQGDDEQFELAQSEQLDVLGRGTPLLFARLFESPFGPHALAAHERAQAARPPVVYGLSSAQQERMALHLASLADFKRRERMTDAVFALGITAFAQVILICAGSVLAYDASTFGGTAPFDQGVFLAFLGGLGLTSVASVAMGLGYSAMKILVPSLEEDISAAYLATDDGDGASATRAVVAVDTLRSKADAEDSFLGLQPTVYFLLAGVSVLAAGAFSALPLLAVANPTEDLSWLGPSLAIFGSFVVLAVLSAALGGLAVALPEKSSATRTLALIEGDPDRPFFIDGASE